MTTNIIVRVFVNIDDYHDTITRTFDHESDALDFIDDTLKHWQVRPGIDVSYTMSLTGAHVIRVSN